MDVVERSSFRRPCKKIVITCSDEPCHDLLFYSSPPISIIPLAELCKLAGERIKVLKILEKVTNCISSKNPDMDGIKEVLLQEFQRQELLTYAKLLVSKGSTSPTESDLKARNEDHISHFISRLIHCHSKNLRRWFMNGEIALFKLRFSSLSSEGIRSFLTAYKIKLIPIPPEEKLSLMPFLLLSTYCAKGESVESMDFFKIPFRDVPDLVGTRKVFLRGGYAYVPCQNLLSIVTSIFKRNLQRGICLAAVSMAYLKEDERLKILLNLHKPNMNETGKEEKKASKVKLEDLDNLAKISFPLCMKEIHEQVRSTHHVKYGARLQYGIFLKSLGLSLRNSIKFWRDEFTTVMSLEEFEKRYLYHIRYIYGLEGRKIPYSNQSCEKILSHYVKPGDCHGCPFKHTNPQLLEDQLANYGISAEDLLLIMNLVTREEYEMACTKYFQIKHRNFTNDVISAPIHFFELSEQFRFLDAERPYRKRKHGQRVPVTDSQGSSSCTYDELTSSDEDCDNVNSWYQCDDVDVHSLSFIERTDIL